MKVSNRRSLGRYKNPETGKAVNVHKARTREGWTVLFFIRSGTRVLIPEANFWGKWEKVNP